MVTLLQTDRVPTILGSASEGTRSLDTEGVSLVDCMQRLRRSARWGLGFLDIDELLVVGDVRAETAEIRKALAEMKHQRSSGSSGWLFPLCVCAQALVVTAVLAHQMLGGGGKGRHSHLP